MKSQIQISVVNINQHLVFSYTAAFKKLGMFSSEGTEWEEIFTSG